MSPRFLPLVSATAAVLFASSAFSQVGFVKRTDLLQRSTVPSGVAVGVADMNGDGRGDIVLSGVSTAQLGGVLFDGQNEATLLWSKVDGPSEVTFADAGSKSTTAVFATGGVYTLRLTADNGTSSASDEVIVTVSGVGTTLIVAIASSADDAEESDADSVWRGSNDLELVLDGARGLQAIGLRFAGLQVPQGATILSAQIQFTADETTSEPTSLVLRAEASSDASAITGSSGNAALIVITGTGERVAQSIDGNPSGAAVLSVTYQ